MQPLIATNSENADSMMSALSAPRLSTMRRGQCGGIRDARTSVMVIRFRTVTRARIRLHLRGTHLACAADDAEQNDGSGAPAIAHTTLMSVRVVKRRTVHRSTAFRVYS
jgi:hypothetical protein